MCVVRSNKVKGLFFYIIILACITLKSSNNSLEIVPEDQKRTTLSDLELLIKGVQVCIGNEIKFLKGENKLIKEKVEDLKNKNKELRKTIKQQKLINLNFKARLELVTNILGGKINGNNSNEGFNSSKGNKRDVSPMRGGGYRDRSDTFVLTGKQRPAIRHTKSQENFNINKHFEVGIINVSTSPTIKEEPIPEKSIDGINKRCHSNPEIKFNEISINKTVAHNGEKKEGKRIVGPVVIHNPNM